MEKQGH